MKYAIDDLNWTMELLASREADVLAQLYVEEKLFGMKRKPDVNLWLENLDRLRFEFDDFAQKFAKLYINRLGVRFFGDFACRRFIRAAKLLLEFRLPKVLALDVDKIQVFGLDGVVDGDSSEATKGFGLNDPQQIMAQLAVDNLSSPSFHLASILGSSFVSPIEKFRIKRKTKTLKRTMRILACRDADIRTQLHFEEKRRGKKRKEEVNLWLESFQSLSCEVNDVAQKVAKSWIWRLTMGSHLDKLVSKAARLYEYRLPEGLTLDVDKTQLYELDHLLDGDRFCYRSPLQREASGGFGLCDSYSFRGSFKAKGCRDAESTELDSSGGGIMSFRRRITSWKLGKLLGTCSFGAVYEGIRDDGFFFAVKPVPLLDQSSHDKERIRQLEQEISLLSQFEHENIVRCLGTDKDDENFYIFLELVPKGSLAKVYNECILRDSQVSAYTRQILNGLKYLHDHNVVHGDIKCANILVDANGSVKLANFGLAKVTKSSDAKMSSTGVAYWMAPEVVNPRNKSYWLAADIWSLGCTVLEMLTRQHPYPHLDQVQALYKIYKGEPPEVPDSLSRDAGDFILKCLQVNPDARPTAVELLDHPFVKEATYLLQEGRGAEVGVVVEESEKGEVANKFSLRKYVGKMRWCSIVLLAG